jgi:hypothetical protein
VVSGGIASEDFEFWPGVVAFMGKRGLSRCCVHAKRRSSLSYARHEVFKWLFFIVFVPTCGLSGNCNEMGQLLIGRRDRQKFLSIFTELRRSSETLF